MPRVWEWIVVGVAIALAIASAACRVLRAFRPAAKTPCGGCHGCGSEVPPRPIVALQPLPSPSDRPVGK